jgi:chitinase
METSQQNLYSRVTALKKRKADLKVWISIGGWSFNDPGSSASTFSELAASKSKQSIFFDSLLNFLETYGFDGVDLDWYVLRSSFKTLHLMKEQQGISS